MNKSQLSDRTPFWGLKLTPDLKYLQGLIANKNSHIKLETNLFRDILKTIIDRPLFEESNDKETETFCLNLKKVSKNHNVSLYHVTMIHVCIMKLFKTALRITSLKMEVIYEDLIEFMKFPPEIAKDFIRIVTLNKKENIDHCLVNSTPRRPSLDAFNWRIDVSISTSSLVRSLVPSILVQMHLSNGTKKSFSMSLSNFHLLRFNVASVLKEMEDVLKRPIFRLNQ